MAVSNRSKGRKSAYSRWIVSIIWAPWWIRTSTVISRSCGRQAITALLWHHFKICYGLSISTAVKLRFVLALTWPIASFSAENWTLRKLWMLPSTSWYFSLFLPLQGKHWTSTRLALGTTFFFGISFFRRRQQGKAKVCFLSDARTECNSLDLFIHKLGKAWASR